MNGRNVACIAAATFIGSVLVIGVASPALGQRPVVVEGRAIDPENQRVVRFGDLNLAQPMGQKSLLRRVGLAVDSLCDTRHIYGAAKTIDYTCSKEAWNSANPQITSAFDRARSGSSLALSAAMVVSVRR